MNSPAYDTHHVLRATRSVVAGRAQSLSTQQAFLPPQTGTSDYGFGIAASERDGRRSIGHGGSINGFNSSLQTYTEDGTTIAILTNTLPAAGAVSAAILKAVLPAR